VSHVVCWHVYRYRYWQMYLYGIIYACCAQPQLYIHVVATLTTVVLSMLASDYPAVSQRNKRYKVEDKSTYKRSVSCLKGPAFDADYYITII